MSDPEMAEITRILAKKDARAFANMRSLLTKLEIFQKEREAASAVLATIDGITDDAKLAYLGKFDKKCEAIMLALKDIVFTTDLDL